MSKNKTVIQILNPLPGGFTHTSKKQAKEYFNRGLARWVHPYLIEFIEEDHRSVSARRSACATVAHWRIHADVGMATLDQIAGLPVIKPEVLLRGKPVAAEQIQAEKPVGDETGRKPPLADNDRLELYCASS